MTSRLVAAVRARPAAAMGLATAASRGTGFLRTLALAWALGVSTLSDAYNLANTAPNMLFQLAVGGVLSSAVVPLLTQSTSDEERQDNARVLLGGVLVVGALASALLALAAPVILRLLTLGAPAASRADLLDVSTTWLLIFAPQVAAYAVGVLCVGVLTAHGRLFVGALAPVMTNMLTIGGVVMFVVAGSRRPEIGGVGTAQVQWLGLLTTLGVASMAAIQFGAARRVEPHLLPRFSLRHPATRHAVGMAPWVVLYVIVNQVGLAVVVALAASTAGGVSAYQWAFTVMQLPHALIAVSIVSAAFPHISKSVTAGAGAASEAITRAANRLLQLLVPAAVVLAGLSPLLATAVVGEEGASLVAAALVGFSVSLVPFSMFQLLTRSSYAYRDVRGPALVNLAVNAVNIGVNIAVLAVASNGEQRVGGLALGHATSYIAGTALMRRRLRVRYGVRVERPNHVISGVAAGIGAAAVLWIIARAFGPTTQVLAALVVGGAAVATAGAVMWLRRRELMESLTLR